MKWTVFRVAKEHRGEHKCDGCDEMIDTSAVLCWVDEETKVFGHIKCVFEFEEEWIDQLGVECGHPIKLACDACGKRIKDVYPQDRAILAFWGSGEFRTSAILHDSDECIAAFEAPNLIWQDGARKLTVISERWTE